MNILSMLARLESAIGCRDLVNQMLLLPHPILTDYRSVEEINLVVGYNSSPRSQTALDLTLWIAHQTRLATSRQVTVQVVYVMEDSKPGLFSVPPQGSSGLELPRERLVGNVPGMADDRSTTSTFVTAAVAELPPCPEPNSLKLDPVEQFDQADRILWQARCLADEWRGSLKTHLRFGCVATELRQVVQAESASLLLLGCTSADNPVIRRLGPEFPCPVLGIPATLE